MFSAEQTALNILRHVLPISWFAFRSHKIDLFNARICFCDR